MGHAGACVASGGLACGPVRGEALARCQGTPLRSVRQPLWAGDSETTPLETKGGAGGRAEHQGVPPMQQETWRRGQGWAGGRANRGAIVPWIADFKARDFFFFSNVIFFLILNFFFLQIEIHPFSIFTFYFMSLLCLFFFFLTTRAVHAAICVR